MSKQVIGRCSECLGLVTVPEYWMGIYPPVPTCESCGARKKDDLPIIDMDPPPERRKMPWEVKDVVKIYKIEKEDLWNRPTITFRKNNG